jgi:hypothetical protein
LLEDRDIEFLHQMNTLAKQNTSLFMHRRNILGDPWKNEVYGYSNAQGARGFLFINNVHFASRPAELHLGPALGLDAAPGTQVEIVSHFPDRKRIVPAEGGNFRIGDVAKVWLRPFEVLMLEVAPPAAANSNLPNRDLSASDAANCGVSLILQHQPPADWMDAHFVNAARLEQKGLTKKMQTWSTDLPSLEGGPHILAIPVKLREGGAEWRYAPTVVEIVQVVARIGEQRISMIPVPDARQFGNTQNAGSSWVVYKFRLNPRWSGKQLQFAVAAYLPQGVEAVAEGWVIEQWWEEPTRPQGDGYYADDPS